MPTPVNYCDFRPLLTTEGTQAVDRLGRSLYRCVNDGCGKGPYPLPTGKIRTVCRTQPPSIVLPPQFTLPARKPSELPCTLRRERIGTATTDCCSGTRQVPVYVCLRFRCCTINAIGTTDAQKIDGVTPHVCNGCSSRVSPE